MGLLDLPERGSLQRFDDTRGILGQPPAVSAEPSRSFSNQDDIALRHFSASSCAWPKQLMSTTPEADTMTSQRPSVTNGARIFARSSDTRRAEKLLAPHSLSAGNQGAI